MATNNQPLQFGSVCVQAIDLNKPVRPHAEPIYATSAYTFNSTEEAIKIFQNQAEGYIYSRWGNPTVEMAEIKIAMLETHGSNIKAKGQMFSSGMAAISSVVLACVKNGEKFLTQHQLYGTTDELFERELKTWQIDNIRADLNDLNKVDKILKKDKSIKLLYIETPSNPLLGVFDIAALSKIAKKHDLKFAVDNTFSSPYCQQPLKLGADFSIHSTTKYLNGHGTGLGGVVVGADEEFMKQQLWLKVKMLGNNSNAFDAWLILQGLKTLELRMKRHCKNARLVAEYLKSHRAVSKVNYCGFKDHPQYKTIRKQMTAFSGMLSFELKGGIDAGFQLMNKIKLCNMVTTLGTVDTLIQHPASMTHVNVPPERRLEAGITDGLVRMSVGIENAQDIINDLEQAMSEF